MATLISFGTSSGKGGRCDEKCYNAEHPRCKCICHGANHGVGFAQARANTAVLADEMIENLTSDVCPRIHDTEANLF